MCGRFVPKNVEPIPVVVEGASGDRQVAIVAWGIAPLRPGGRPFLACNARAESLTERPTCCPLVARSRCLVPASGGYA